MPNGGESLLGQQLGAAVEIPYKNVALAQNMGKTFLNAFYAAAEVNRKRQQLENQLFKTQLDMSFKEQKHEDDMRQMAWMNQYRLSEEQRRSTAAYEQADIRERTAALRETIGYNKLGEIKSGMDATGALSDAVKELREKYDPGTIGYRTGLEDIIAQNRDAMNTKPGAGLVKMYRDEDKQATNQLHKDAVEAHQTFQENLTAFGKSKEFGIDDFRQPDRVWGRNPDGSRWIARDATTKQRLTPQEVNEKKSEGVNFYTLTPDQYRIQRKAFDRVNKYLSGDPANLPSVDTSPKPTKNDIEHLKNNREKENWIKAFDARFGDGAADTYLNQ